MPTFDKLYIAVTFSFGVIDKPGTEIQKLKGEKKTSKVYSTDMIIL